MIYSKYRDFLLDHLSGETIKVALLGPSYVPNDAHEFYSDVSAAEIAPVTGYTTGGQALANLTINGGVVDADNPSWSIAGAIQVQYAVFYIDSGDPSTSRLLSFHRFINIRTAINGTFTLEISPSGIFKLV
jgi:hypothetical protein